MVELPMQLVNNCAVKS